jgi:hypothetical protein
VPYAPVTVTFAFEFVVVVAQLAAAALVELALAELFGSAADFDELQPARVAPASRGMAMTARKRRMKSSKWLMSAWPAYLQTAATCPRSPILDDRLRLHSGIATFYYFK